MPIGSSKLGVLGAGLVPGGTETFNAPGTFSIPPGVKKVSITGKGGTGNPGNAGNPGNPGNSGSGGGGGGGGGTGPLNGASGGAAWNPGDAVNPANFNNRNVSGGSSNNPGTTGTSGNAGTAGNPGNPGNTGQSSSALGNTFCGGAGGNAGVAGAAGNGGSGGPGGLAGQAGNSFCSPGLGGSGGTGAGQGGRAFVLGNPGCTTTRFGGRGGGGASANVDGSPAFFPGNANAINPAFPPTFNSNSIATSDSGMSGAGAPDPSIAGNLPANLPGPIHKTRSPNKVTPLCPVGRFYYGNSPSPGPLSNPEWLKRAGGSGSGPNNGQNVGICGFLCLPNPTIGPNPAPQSNWWRAGGGGGQGGPCSPNGNPYCFGPFNATSGGGGGGGRGNVGNAGGTSPTPSGQAATPATFNCVPVTPGGTSPITVASPGGQIVISWNPQ